MPFVLYTSYLHASAEYQIPLPLFTHHQYTSSSEQVGEKMGEQVSEACPQREKNKKELCCKPERSDRKNAVDLGYFHSVHSVSRSFPCKKKK